jgi:hypothetical protein
MLISKPIEALCGRDNIKFLEDIFEAFICALYTDAGFNICRDFIINLIQDEIDFASILHNETNYKDILLRYFHKQQWASPTYETIQYTGPEHKKNFKMCVKDNKGNIIGIGNGSCKKTGEQFAAKQALLKFGLLDNPDQNDHSDYSQYHPECSNYDQSENPQYPTPNQTTKTTKTTKTAETINQTTKTTGTTNRTTKTTRTINQTTKMKQNSDSDINQKSNSSHNNNSEELVYIHDDSD